MARTLPAGPFQGCSARGFVEVILQTPIEVSPGAGASAWAVDGKFAALGKLLLAPIAPEYSQYHMMDCCLSLVAVTPCWRAAAPKAPSLAAPAR